jgi:quercetin dioxygenase-like cupin family protein
MTTQATRPFSSPANPTFTFLGIPSVAHASAESTGGAFYLAEHLAMPPGSGSPYHTHHDEDESFYILEGEVAFVVDGSWTKAGPHTFVYGPREIPHGFVVVGAGPARMLLMSNPGAFEGFVRALSQPLSAPPAEPDMGLMIATAAKYHIDIHGPLPELPAGW